MTNNIKKAVIAAAGLGTRFLPFTKAMPKEMLPIVDKPAIQLIVEEIVASGISDIMIVTSPYKNAMQQHFSSVAHLENYLRDNNKPHMLQTVQQISNMAEISFCVQQRANGLADAVYCAKDFTGGQPFALLLGDDIVYTNDITATKQLTDIFETTDKSVIGVQKVSKTEAVKYGIITGDQIGRYLYKINDIIEKPSQPPTDIAIMGRYVLHNDIFGIIENTPKLSNEVMFTDSLKLLADKKGVYAYEFVGKRYDTGDKLGYLTAMVEYGLRSDLKQQFAKYLKDLIDKGL